MPADFLSAEEFLPRIDDPEKGLAALPELYDYLFQTMEQLRYRLSNLGPENVSKNAIDEKAASSSGNFVTSGALFDVNQMLNRQNMLDNWYFVGEGSQGGRWHFPINQRNGYFIPPNTAYYNDVACTVQEDIVGEYTEVRYINETSGELIWSSGNASGKYAKRESMLPGYVKGGYGIDRWKVPAKTVLTLQSNGMRLQTFEAAKQFAQFFENYDIFDGKMLTASILWGDGTFSSGSLDYDNSSTGWDNHTFFTAKGVRVLITKNHGFDLYMQEPRDVEIAAVKLEIGSTQTLAHQENGVWVINDLPNYQQELVKCQRYQFQVIQDNLSGGEFLIAGIGALNALGQTSIIFIPTPSTMAKKPTVSYSGDWWVHAKEDGKPVIGIDVDGWSYAGIFLYVTHDFLSGDSVTLQSYDGSGLLPPNGKILFDANL